MALRPSSHVHTLPSGVDAGVHTGVDAEIVVGMEVGVDAGVDEGVHRWAETDAGAHRLMPMGCTVKHINSFPHVHVVHRYTEHVHRRDPQHPHPCMDIAHQCSHS